MHSLESVLGKTGLLGVGELFWERSGLVKPRELLFVHGMFLKDAFLLSDTLHSRRKTGDLWGEESPCKASSSEERAFNSCTAGREWASC